MKYFTAVVRRSLAGRVIHAVEDAGFCILCVSEVSTLAELHDPSHEHLSFMYEGTYSSMCKVEILCDGTDEARLLEVLKKTGRTDHPGDGYVLAWSVDRGIRIRTGKEGLAAFGEPRDTHHQNDFK